jgi:hypothetical protein
MVRPACWASLITLFAHQVPLRTEPDRREVEGRPVERRGVLVEDGDHAGTEVAGAAPRGRTAAVGVGIGPGATALRGEATADRVDAG